MILIDYLWSPYLFFFWLLCPEKYLTGVRNIASCVKSLLCWQMRIGKICGHGALRLYCMAVQWSHNCHNGWWTLVEEIPNSCCLWCVLLHFYFNVDSVVWQYNRVFMPMCGRSHAPLHYVCMTCLGLSPKLSWPCMGVHTALKEQSHFHFKTSREIWTNYLPKYHLIRSILYPFYQVQKI